MSTDTDVKILGVRVHGVALSAALERIEGFIRAGTPHQVCVANVWTTVLMQSDPELLRINNSADLVVADGMPLAWVSRLFGNPLPERISGSDLFHGFHEIAFSKGYKVFLLGSSPRTLEALSRNLSASYPNLNIVGTYAPPFREDFSQEDSRRMLEVVNSAQPDLLWVSLSAPKQEKWIGQNLSRLDVPVAIGVGAVFDFASGIRRRAPLWMQKAGIEWLHRLCLEPSRLWKRYLIGNSLFIWHVLKHLLQ
jgi:N-acetylglucosaminyldiphosphoundecaprenol N-acetyl-beta-D-mannosaminyltransferase